MKYSLIFWLIFQVFVVQGQDTTDMFHLVNSTHDEQQPVLSPDRKTLYFTRANHPGNVGGLRDPGDIWYSEMNEDGKWSEPKNARELNNSGYNSVLGFTVDNRTIYLHNHYNKDNSAASTQGISRAVRKGSGWGRPENMTIPYFLNRSNQQSGFISKDGQVLILSIQGYGTIGAEDLYVCFNEGGKWSEPKNLGMTVNSSAQEFTPYLSGDKQTLYYSSNGKGGKGSSDVFMVSRKDDTWKNWTEPAPVDEINTQGRELGYREYEGFVLYTSTVNSDGYSDIRFYAPNKDQSIEPVKVVNQDTLSAITEVNKPGKDYLYGTVKNADSREPVPTANIVINNDEEHETVPLESGATYAYNFTKPGTYTIRIDAPGYISVSDHIEITTQGAAPIERNFLLDPIVVGKRVHLENVLFQRSTPNILPGSFEELNMVAAFMKANPSVKIRLEGHTDNTGVPKHNLRLSQARVESVEKYLVSKGIDHKRISGKGYGGTKPIADNSQEETRKLNRRVEFTIVKN